MNPIRAGLLILLTLTPPSSLLGSPVESMRVEGRSGWVVTDDPTPRLEWTPSQNKVSKWELQAEIEARGNTKSSTWKPAPFDVSEGPWKVWQGPELTAGTQVRWRVRSIDAAGKASSWSPEQDFERGLPGNWKTDWIGMDPEQRGEAAALFRKEFQASGPTKGARLYISGLGYHESWLNGVRLGEGVLEPGQTDYEQRVFYITHDIESILRPGTNVLAVRVGDGFFNQNKVWGPKGMSYGEPRMCARLIIHSVDGSRQEIVTDTSWKCHTGAITSSNIYHGETHDARIAKDGWTSIDYNDSSWFPVVKTPQPGGIMEAESLPPIVRHKPLPVKNITEPTPGIKIYDFGQNFTGWCRLKVQAPAGTKIIMTFAEGLGNDGHIDTLSTGTIHTKADQIDTYICRGGEVEIWEPSFAWHGFQFVEVRMEDGIATEIELEGIPTHTRMPIRGKFNSSDPLINRLLETAHWTQVSNTLSLPMDCPARERCGWTGDAHLYVPFTMYRYDTSAMWRKFMRDMLTTAERTEPMPSFGMGMGDRKVRPKARGIPTMVAPGKRFIGEASPDWGSAVVFIPWDLYQFSGDQRVLSRNLEPMRQWTSHVAALADKDGIVNAGLGDWCRPWPSYDPEADRGAARDYYGEVIPMLSTACLFRCADIMANTEKILGDPAKVKEWRNLANQSRDAFFLAMEKHQGWSYQSMMAIAIEWGIAPVERHQEIADRLAKQVRKDGNHFMTGVFGAPSLWPALSNHGYKDLAHTILNIETAPSFRYLFKRGATSFWEVWPAEVDEGRPWERSMSHPFHGAFAHWFYSGLAGIKMESPGFTQIRLQPVILPDLREVDCRFRSAMGWIESSWKRDGQKLTWNVEVPVGATARIIPPGSISAWNHAGSPLKFDADRQEQVISSGRYRFEIELD